MSVLVSSLDAAQIQLLTQFDGQQRSAILAMVQAYNAAVAAQLQWNNAALAIIVGITNTETLPTATGLNGARPMSQPDAGAIAGILGTFVAWFQANMQSSGNTGYYVEACGSLNVQALP